MSTVSLTGSPGQVFYSCAKFYPNFHAVVVTLILFRASCSTCFSLEMSWVFWPFAAEWIIESLRQTWPAIALLPLC